MRNQPQHALRPYSRRERADVDTVRSLQRQRCCGHHRTGWRISQFSLHQRRPRCCPNVQCNRSVLTVAECSRDLSAGVSAFVLKYRVPARPQLPGLPKWWAPLQDAQRAIGLVRSKAKQFGLNASRIGFTGSSAGGHLTAHVSTSFMNRSYARIDAADDLSSRPDFAIFQYPWMLLPDNKVPAWGAAYSLADELSGMASDHPVSAFVQNIDDTTAPPQGTLAYAQKLLALGVQRKPVIHMYNEGGHGYGYKSYLAIPTVTAYCRLCQGLSKWLEVCDWPKVAQRFLQDLGMAPGWPSSSADQRPAMQLEQGCKRC